MQAQLAKIRSDAAECLLLGSLASNEKKEMFAKMAEHLNDLALEVEKAMATSGASVAIAVPQTETDAPDLTTGQQETVTDLVTVQNQPTRNSRVVFPWLIATVSVVFAAALFGANLHLENYPSLSFEKQSKDETPGMAHDDLRQARMIFRSREHAERGAIRGQLGTLAERMENLERALGELKTARNETAGTEKSVPPVAEEKPVSTEQKLSVAGKPSVAEEGSSPAETNSVSPKESAVVAKQPESAPNAPATPSAPATSGTALARVDRLGPVAAVGGAEFDRHRPTIGPPGCTNFRSFDAVSGTYTAFDRRRRPCN